MNKDKIIACFISIFLIFASSLFFTSCINYDETTYDISEDEFKIYIVESYKNIQTIYYNNYYYTNNYIIDDGILFIYGYAVYSTNTLRYLCYEDEILIIRDNYIIQDNKN
jgi:hypothetical protein